MARIVFSRAARRQVAELDSRLADAVVNAVTALAGDPKSGKRLWGRFGGLWSLRLGSYRVVYELRDAGKPIRVVAVLHRRIAYRADPR